MTASREKYRYLLLTFWEYAGEVIGAVLIYSLLRLLFGAERIAAFCITRHSGAVLLIGILLAASVAIAAVFWQLLSTEFGKQIRIAGEAAAYSRAFAFPILVSLITLVLVLTAGGGPIATNLIILVSLYNLLTFVTMVVNMQRHAFFSEYQTQPSDRQCLNTHSFRNS